MEKTWKWVVTVGQEIDNRMQPESRVYAAFAAGLRGRQLDVELKKIGSFGTAPGETVVTVYSNTEQWVYPHVTPERVGPIIEKHLVGGTPVKDWIDTNAQINLPQLNLFARKPKALKLDQYSGASQLLEGEPKAGGATAPQQTEESNYSALNIIGIGWYIAIFMILGIVGGIWLDNLWHTRPLFFLIGLVAGFVCVGLGVARVIKRLIELNQRPYAARKHEKPPGPTMEDVSAVKQQADEHIRSICEQGHKLVSKSAEEVAERQAQTKGEMKESVGDLVTQAKSLIAQDRLEAIARLRREYADLAAAAGLGDDSKDHSDQDIETEEMSHD